MNTNDAIGIMGLLGMIWPREQLKGDTEKLWAATLLEYDRELTIRAIHRLKKSHKWRPSLSEIIAEIKPEAAGETALEAFQSVRRCMSLPAAERRDAISVKAYQAVQRIGGWAYVGTWQLDQMHHHQRLFCEAFNDVEARHADNERLGLPPPDSEPHKALSAAVQKALGAKGGKRHLEPVAAPEPPESEPAEVTADERLKVADQAAAFLERLKRG